MTAEEARVLATARVAMLGADPSSTKAPSYRRLSVRQQQLYQRAAGVNPEWSAIRVIATLDAGSCDLALIDDADIAEPARMHLVRIEDPGTSNYGAGQQVHIVTARDGFGNEAPRCTIEDRVLWTFDDDLADVVSLRLFYPRVPLPLPADEDGTSELELPEPHVELLVIDLAKWLLRRTPVGEGVAAGLRVLDEEEEEALATFDLHVTTYGGTLRERH